MNKNPTKFSFMLMRYDRKSHDAFMELRYGSEKRIKNRENSQPNISQRYQGRNNLNNEKSRKRLFKDNSIPNRSFCPLGFTEERFLWQNLDHKHHIDYCEGKIDSHRKRIDLKDCLEGGIGEFEHNNRIANRRMKRCNSCSSIASSRNYGNQSFRVMRPNLITNEVTRPIKRREGLCKRHLGGFGRTKSQPDLNIFERREEDKIERERFQRGGPLIDKTPAVFPIRGKRHLDEKQKFFYGQLNIFQGVDEASYFQRKKKVYFYDVMDGKFNREIAQNDYIK